MGNSIGFSWIAAAQWYADGKKNYGAEGFRRSVAEKCGSDPLPTIDGKVAVVTGANSGIGLETSKWLAELGGDVTLVCRSAARGEEAAAKIAEHVVTCGKYATPDAARSHLRVEPCDMAVFADVRSLAARIAAATPSVHILVNNAGCMPPTLELTREGNETIFATMLGGTLLLTALLRPALTLGRGRVINVSSGGAFSVKAHAPAIPINAIATTGAYDGTLVYAYSKRLQIIVTRLLAHRWRPEVALASMHPGWADTEAVRSSMPDFYKKHKDKLRSPKQGADTIVYLATMRDAAAIPPGSLWFDRAVVGEHTSWGCTSVPPEHEEALLQQALQYCGLGPQDI